MYLINRTLIPNRALIGVIQRTAEVIGARHRKVLVQVNTGKQTRARVHLGSSIVVSPRKGGHCQRYGTDQAAIILTIDTTTSSTFATSHDVMERLLSAWVLVRDCQFEIRDPKDLNNPLPIELADDGMYLSLAYSRHMLRQALERGKI